MAIQDKYPIIKPSLNLDFANTKSLDPRIEFTRASSATYFDEFGVLKTAAANAPRIDHNPITGECLGLLIEEQRTNLLTYSEQFDNATWLKFAASIAMNTSASPDGLISADKLIESTDSSRHFVYQNVSVTSGNSYTFSVFVKPAGRSVIRIDAGDAQVGAGNYADFNLSSKTATAFGNCTASIVESSNGYLHCRCTFIATNSAATAFTVELHNGTSNSYAGDGTSGIYIWGAQLEAGAFPTSYIPTTAVFTSRNSTGTYFDSTGVMKTAAINEPRYDHGLVDGQWVSKGLMLENSATNLVTYSEQFDNAAWVKTNATVITNAVVAPDGTLTADKLVESAINGAHFLNQNAPSIAANTVSTGTVFAQLGERRYFQLRVTETSNVNNHVRAIFDLQTGTVTETISAGVASGVVALIEPNGAGRYRCSVSGIPGTSPGIGTRLEAYLMSAPSGTAVYTGDGTSGIYIWGAQLEVGSQPTSYIKTEAASVTRAADLSTSSQVTRVADNAVMTGSNFSSWYRQDEGAFFVDALSLSNVAERFLSVNSGSTANRIDLLKAATRQIQLLTMSDGALTTSNQVTADAFSKVAAAYKANDIAASLNGGDVATDLTASLPSATQINIGATAVGSSMLNGYIKRLSYYPKRLTNDHLVALTQ